MSIDTQPASQTAERRSVAPGMPSPASGRQPKSGARWKFVLLAAAAIGVLAVGVLPLARTFTSQSGTQALTHSVTRGDLVVSVTEQGTLESSSNKEIKCKVKGTSTVLWVIETGTQVKPGDELIRLDTSSIEDNISQQKIVYENALANKTTSESDVAVATIAITEYLEGTFRSEMASKQRELVIAESNLKSAKTLRDHTQRMFRKGYVTKLEMGAEEDAVSHAELEVEVKQIELEVLEKFTKAKTLQELQSALEVAQARLASDRAALELEAARLARAEKQLENCVIRAEVGGMVIYPSAAAWKEQPDIEEGATVREDQVLLMIPDLTKMQVKVGIHESKVERLRIGMPARIEIQNGSIDGEVSSIASVARPAGWWSGNLVKYDTIINLKESRPGLKPGMSTAVEIFLARYENRLIVPVAAVLEQGEQFLCWVETADGFVKRSLKLGDSNDQFVIVQDGLKEGERVALNPLDFLADAQRNELRSIEKAKPKDEDRLKREPGRKRSGAGGAKPSDTGKRKAPDTGRKKPSKDKTAQRIPTGADIIKVADKNGDGKLTIDEVDEKSKSEFAANDVDGDGSLDAAELDAVIKRKMQAGGGKK